MNKNILVTGGAGFIGSHVCEALLGRGDRVVCIDNFDPYYDKSIKEQNLSHFDHSENFTLVEGDIRCRETLQKLASDQEEMGHPINAVIHLAARAGVRPSIEDPALYTDVNLGGTTQLLDMARENNIKNFVFASSSSVYGERKEVPFKETDRVDHPVSPYAATKKAGELLCHSYHHIYGLDVACLRFFTVYGPRQRPEMAIHKFTRLIDEGQPIPMFGTGDSQRDFTYVDDIVSGVLAAIDNNSGFEIYNLGNKKMIALRDLIQLIADSLGKEADIQQLPNQAGDVSKTCADISHSKKQLGYNPSTSIDAGILKFVDWYQGVGNQNSKDHEPS